MHPYPTRKLYINNKSFCIIILRDCRNLAIIITNSSFDQASSKPQKDNLETVAASGYKTKHFPAMAIRFAENAINDWRFDLQRLVRNICKSFNFMQF